jgi:hypothetical protein
MREPRTLIDARKATALREDLPHVETYYDKVHQAAWLGRNSGVWTGVGTGGSIGALMGAATSFLPYALGYTDGVLPDVMSVVSLSALSAGLGAAYGMTVMPDVGVTAAAVAAGLEERERRDKLEKLRETNPELAAKVEQARARQVNDFEQAGTPKSSWLKRAWTRFGQYYDVKVGVIGLALSAAVGAILALNPHIASPILGEQGMKLISSSTTGIPSGAAIASSAGLFAMFGAVFGVKMAMVSNLLSNASYQILTGNIFKKDEPAFAPELAPELARAQEAAKPALEPIIPAPHDDRPQTALSDISSLQLAADHAARLTHDTAALR